MRRLVSTTSLSVCLNLVLIAAAFGDDWPQYRGPHRDDVSAEKGLLAEWPADGPKLLATFKQCGIGYSGPAVIGDRMYVTGGRGDKEYLIALDLKSARAGAIAELWAAEIGPLFDWKGNQWSAGPSATPTVDGPRVYALGGAGDLLCCDVADGKPIWSKRLPADLDAEVNPIGGGPKKLGWGFTWSPLVDGDQLICLPGGPKGTVASLDKRTGELRWRSTQVTHQAAYTSPIAAEIGGRRQYVVLTNQGVFGIDSADGRLLWMFEQRYGTEVVNSPIVRGPLVYVTVGGSHGSQLLRLSPDGDRFQVESVYSNRNLANHHGDVVLVDGHVYGATGGRGWVCQNLESGEIAWTDRTQLKTGAVTYADGRLYTFAESDGTAMLVEASAKACTVVGRLKLPEQSKLRKPQGKIWTPPVVSGGRLFLRDQENLFCYEVAK